MTVSKRPSTSGSALRLTGVTLGIVLALLVGLLFGTPVSAETPNDIVDQLSDDGVYVARARSEVDAETLIAAVEDVRFDGLRVVVAAPIDPQPDAKAFARRIQEATSADIGLVFPKDGPLEAFVIDDLDGSKIRSTVEARAQSDPAQAVRVFAQEITSEREATRPPIVGRLITGVVLLTLALGVATVLEQLINRRRRSRRSQTISASSAHS